MNPKLNVEDGALRHSLYSCFVLFLLSKFHILLLTSSHSSLIFIQYNDRTWDWVDVYDNCQLFLIEIEGSIFYLYIRKLGLIFKKRQVVYYLLTGNLSKWCQMYEAHFCNDFVALCTSIVYSWDLVSL